VFSYFLFIYLTVCVRCCIFYSMVCSLIIVCFVWCKEYRLSYCC
jgi:hypothetical protein